MVACVSLLFEISERDLRDAPVARKLAKRTLGTMKRVTSDFFVWPRARNKNKTRVQGFLENQKFTIK